MQSTSRTGQHRSLVIDTLSALLTRTSSCCICNINLSNHLKAEHPFGTTRRGVASDAAESSDGSATITSCSRAWRKSDANGGSPRKPSGLTTLAYNPKRVLNLVSFEKLMSILRRTASEDRAAVG